jgi:hypothetical protein
LEAIGKLSPVVAHDINNLLSGILGYSQIMLSDPAAGNLKPYIEEIEIAGKRIAALARILQVFNQKQIHHAELLDLNLMVQEIEKFIPPIIGPEIHFISIKEPRLWLVRDKARIRRQFLALAIDAQDMLSQGGTLTLETRNSEIAASSLDKREERKREVLLAMTLKGFLPPDLALFYPHEKANGMQTSTQETSSETLSLSGIIHLCSGRISTTRRSDDELVVHACLPAATESAVHEPAGKGFLADGSVSKN